MLMLILIAVIATDVAVGVLFFTLRRHTAEQQVDSYDPSIPDEVDDLVAGLRADTEQAAEEIARQRAQLRRMLAGAEREGRSPVAVAPVVTRTDLLRMAAEGMSLRAIAGRTALSLEEVRLMLAMAEQEALAA